MFYFVVCSGPSKTTAPSGFWARSYSNGVEWGICIGTENGARVIANEYFRPTPIDTEHIAVVDTQGTLHRLHLDTADAEPIWEGLPGDGRFGWTVHDGMLIYNTAAATANNGHIIRRDIESGAETVLYVGPMPLADSAVSVAPGNGDILFTRFEAASDDLVTFRGASLLR